MRRFELGLFLIVVQLLAGCASIDFDRPKPQSTAISPAVTADSPLGSALNGLADANIGKSGFYMLPNGIDALAIRLLMAQQAEHSIDTQYYLITNDLIGRLFVESLLRAAERGVRVRLLLDDIQTKGYDPGLSALNAHPNVEVRIYNPFARRSARGVSAVSSFTRINRRMHNKSFTVDNQMTVIGGRNIADEYFAARQDVNFGDLDVVGVGPIVTDVSSMFDEFWNSRPAVPVAVFADPPDDPQSALADLRDRLQRTRTDAGNTRYAEALRSSLLSTMQKDLSVFTWAPSKLVYDSPDKSDKQKADESASIRTPLIEAFDAAKRDAVIISPYFVPRKTGIERFAELRERGIDVSVVTNSLVSTNQTTVHGGYAPARKPLLEMGVRLYELRADADIAGTEYVSSSGAKATLHTKAFAIDSSRLFIGSFNFDPRSAYINTEMGVIIDSNELAGAFTKAVHDAAPHETYEVLLNEKGKLRWQGLEDGNEVILNKEPQAGFWRRFVGGFMRLLPIRRQL